MAGETVLKPNLQAIKQIMASGGESVKKCFQCATCSVVCNISPDTKPFPRKEMIMAQWGLTEELVKNPDIWLCHQCSDCTAYCPRGAKPGEVLGALRQICIQHYATPAIVGRLVGDPKALPLLIAFPILLLLAALKLTGHLAIPAGPIVYAKLFPTLLVDVIFTGAAAFAVAVLVKGVLAYWKDLNVNPWKVKAKGNLVGNLIAVLTDILWHNRFRKCEVTYARSTNHLLVLFGFIFLAVVTGLAFYHEWFEPHDKVTSVVVTMKLLAIPGTAALLYGIYQIIKERQANAEQAGTGSYFDWMFIYVVLVVGVTGLLSWLFRLVGIRLLAYPTYFLHLSSVFFLFFYAPYTKMAHMVYRTVAMLYARMSDRGF
jgi:quinone-modifying oxidoreductase subunit QmoC